MSDGYVKFWGVRGSIPTPLTAKDVEEKFEKMLDEISENVRAGGSLDKFLYDYRPCQPLTYGGNTSCVELRFGDTTIVFDMGTGLRELGLSLFPQMFRNKGLEIYFFLSHVHWDHIQGLPFFGPLYVNKETGIKNHWHFFGGTDWQETAETVLKGQMDPPEFPVSFREIEANTFKITPYSMRDMMHVTIDGETNVMTRKLNHPQETYGMRVRLPNEKIVVYTTDNEPFDPEEPDDRLLSLVQDADYWITDCQYTKNQYNGYKEDGSPGGFSRRGWGHSYPEAVAKTALVGKVKNVLLFHHDPGSNDSRIEAMETYTQGLVGKDVKVIAAHEGLILDL